MPSSVSFADAVTQPSRRLPDQQARDLRPGTTYVPLPLDTLESVARRAGMSAKQLRDANPQLHAVAQSRELVKAGATHVTIPLRFGGSLEPRSSNFRQATGGVPLLLSFYASGGGELRVAVDGKTKGIFISEGGEYHRVRPSERKRLQESLPAAIAAVGQRISDQGEFSPEGSRLKDFTAAMARVLELLTT